MIDAHVHLWRLGQHGCAWPTPEVGSIYRDFTLDELKVVVGTANIDRVILVQSQEDDRDTNWLLSIAGNQLIAGVVGWVDFASADAPDAIGSLASNGKLCGLRPMVQDRAANWYDAPELDTAFQAMKAHDLVLDALVRPRHLPSLLRLGVRHGDLSIVIDHGAKPIADDLDSWAGEMELLAQLPNVSCKLSGLLTELPPGASTDAVAPMFDRIWNAFGADRLIWGSDWPVLTLAGDYASWLDQCRRLVPSVHHQAVFDANARRTYRIA